jgi:ATP-dependent Clp protease ATP-binding subunit ClpA
MKKLEVGNWVQLVSDNPRQSLGDVKHNEIGKIVEIDEGLRLGSKTIQHLIINFKSQFGWRGFSDEVKLVDKPEDFKDEDFEGEDPRKREMDDMLDSLRKMSEGRFGTFGGISSATATKTKSKPKALENLRLMGIENPYIFNREKETELLEKTLIQFKKPNAILVGRAGVGKTAIVEKLAYMLKEDKCCDILKGYEIYEFTLNKAAAGTRYRGDFEEKIEQMLQYVEDKKIILFIDEIHNIMELGGTEGAVSMDEAIKPYLARGQIRIIGATTEKEYKKISTDSAFERRFRKIIVNEPTNLETIEIVTHSTRPYIMHYNINITERNIKDIVYAGKSIKGANPDKAFTLMELALSNAKYNKRNEITKEDIDYAVNNY